MKYDYVSTYNRNPKLYTHYHGNPYVSVAGNYCTHQSLRIYNQTWNRRQVLSATKLAVHAYVQLYLVQSKVTNKIPAPR